MGNVRGMSRRAALAGAAGLVFVPKGVLASEGPQRFAPPPWSGYRSVERRQAEASRLLTPDEATAGVGWRDDMDRSHLAGIHAVATLQIGRASCRERV